MKSDTICKSLEAGSCEFVMSALSKELSHFVRQQLAKAHLAGGDVKARNLFNVIVNYGRVLSLSITNFATKLDVIFRNI